MATAYRVLASNPVPVIVPGTLQTREVQAVTVQAIPSGVTFTVHVDELPATPDAVHAAAEPVAEAVNELAGRERVSRLAVMQEQNAGGVYEDALQVTVTSTSGRSTATFVVPFAQLGAGEVDDAVTEAVSRLDAVEAL